jgi:hypothetical protein
MRAHRTSLTTGINKRRRTMPIKPHPTDPDKMVYTSRHYDIPQLQGVTTPQRPWVDLTPQDLNEIFAIARSVGHAVNLAADKLKEKNT